MGRRGTGGRFGGKLIPEPAQGLGDEPGDVPWLDEMTFSGCDPDSHIAVASGGQVR